MNVTFSGILPQIKKPQPQQAKEGKVQSQQPSYPQGAAYGA